MLKLPRYKPVSFTGILSHSSKSAKAERVYMRLRKRLMMHVDEYSSDIMLTHIDRRIETDPDTGRTVRVFARQLTDDERLGRKVAYRTLIKSIKSDTAFFTDMLQLLQTIADIRAGKSSQYKRLTKRTDKSQELGKSTRAIHEGQTPTQALGILVDALMRMTDDDPDYRSSFASYRRDDWHGQS